MINDNGSSRNWRRIGLTVLLFVGCGIVAAILIRTSDRNMPFDEDVWRENALVLNGSDLRQRMVNDLQRNVLTQGMTRVEIESLLGNHESGFFTDDYDLVYRLGSISDTGAVARHGASIRSNGHEQWLALKLDDRGRLVEWRVVNH